MINTTRRIFKNSVTGPQVLQELLQAIFVSELLVPSQNEIWIVSPWISDIPIIDNSSAGYDIINPDWRGRLIKLSEVLVQMSLSNMKLNIVTNFDDHNIAFHNRIEEKIYELSLGKNITLIKKDGTHMKGLLTDKGFLAGSMNFTQRGIFMNDEWIHYDISKKELPQVRLHFEEIFLKE
tara:strand:- start:569 stop:1105 length:537 start_codon:yes stop_codon:yes gene_type:complete